MAASKRTIDLGELRRIGAWGLAAAAAVTLLGFSILSGPAHNEPVKVAALAIERAKPAPPARRPEFDPQEASREASRLAEQVRTLTADRERLLSRIASLEQDLEDVTGSIVRAAAAPQTDTGTADPKPATSAPGNVPAPAAAMPQVHAAVVPVAPTAAPPAPESVTVAIPPTTPSQHGATQSGQAASEAVSQPEFGIDIGRSATVEGLRAQWTAVRSRHAAQLEGLRPIVFMQKGERGGRVELRLVAGPIGSAAAAAILCATMTAAGTACRPEVWDGERLALR